MSRPKRNAAKSDNGNLPGNEGNPGTVEPAGASAGDRNSDANAAGSNTIDPTSVGSNDDNDNRATGKRGWPKGRKRGPRTTTAATPADISGIEKLLFGIHTVASHLIAPEFAMSPEDCSELSTAISNVNRHYNFALLDQKQADWFNLIQLVAVAYGTRIFAIRERHKREARPIPAPRPQTGQPVPGNPAGPTHEQLRAAAGMNGATDRAIRTGEVPGLGKIEFPPDHPLSRH